MASALRFENITKRFGHQEAVRGVSLTIPGTSRFALLGPSGCGKTTLLRMAAGFESPCEGRVFLDDKDITGLPPEQRPVNTVFQHYSLFPHMTVWENIAFGPRRDRRSKAEIRAEVERMLALVDMTAHADKHPAQLSGGQKQRVGIARALAKHPAVLLLDEPLAALDLKLRQRMLAELNRIHREVGTTFVYVTHDQGEAMSISDSIAVMNEGRIQQVGTPHDIYHRPSNAFVAGFIGDTNFLEGCVEAADALIIEDLGRIIIPRPDTTAGGPMMRLSLRPENIRIARDQESLGACDNRAPGRVTEILCHGSHNRIQVRCGKWHMETQTTGHSASSIPSIHAGDEVWIGWNADDSVLLPMDSKEREGV